MDLEVRKDITGRVISAAETPENWEEAYLSNARISKAWIRAMRAKAHVHFELGRYMIDVDRLLSNSFTAYPSRW
jgi:hypothetical protein